MQANQTAEAAECVIIRRESELRGLEGGNNRNALAGYSDLSAVTSGNGSVDKLRGSTISLFQGPASEQREREREREREKEKETMRHVREKRSYMAYYRMRVLLRNRNLVYCDNNYVRTAYSIMPIMLLGAAHNAVTQPAVITVDKSHSSIFQTV